MSDLHRDKGATHNFSRMWKIREDSRNKREKKWARKWGTRPWSWALAPVVWPIRSHIMDYASTTFDDQ
jgi:hypothetical protein